MKLWILLIICSAQACKADVVNHQVFSLSHLRDEAFEVSREDNITWIASKHTLLVLYEPRCRSEKYLENFKMLSEHMPHPKTLTYLQHDYKTFPEKIWYSRTGDDMKKKFSIRRCPTAVFIHKGDPVEEFEAWDSNKDKSSFSAWFWNLLKIDIFLETHFDEQVVITFIGPGPQIQPETFSKGGNGNFIAYVGYYVVITIRASNDVLYTQLIDWSEPKNKIVVSSTAEPIAKFKEWKEMADKEQHEYLVELKKQENILQSMYIRTFKQPLLLGYISELGYSKTTVAHGLLAQLVKYWEMHRTNVSGSNDSIIRQGNRSEFDHWLYCRDDYVQTLTLSPIKYNSVGRELNRLVEEWLQIPVDFIRVNDIVHLSAGSYIRPHVSRADEPIMAMVVLDTCENEDTDIYFEIMDYQSRTAHTVSLEVGAVFIYESATLVLSLMDPLINKQCLTFVTAVFRPANEWIWIVPKNNMYVKMGPRYNIKEPFDDIQQKILTGDKPERLDIDTFSDGQDNVRLNLSDLQLDDDNGEDAEGLNVSDSPSDDDDEMKESKEEEKQKEGDKSETTLVVDVPDINGKNHDEL